jgi:hypothetical protein
VIVVTGVAPPTGAVTPSIATIFIVGGAIKGKVTLAAVGAACHVTPSGKVTLTDVLSPGVATGRAPVAMSIRPGVLTPSAATCGTEADTVTDAGATLACAMPVKSITSIMDNANASDRVLLVLLIIFLPLFQFEF